MCLFFEDSGELGLIPKSKTANSQSILPQLAELELKHLFKHNFAVKAWGFWSKSVRKNQK